MNLGGNIRTFPRDFLVEEVWETRVCSIKYSLFNRLRDQMVSKFQREKDYIHFTLVKKKWETIRALNYVCRKLGVSLKRVGISGMKDKQAITAQRVSLWKGKVKTIARLHLKDMVLKDFEYATDRINLGDAIGNRFRITIRNIPKKEREILKMLREFSDLVTSQGIPNYYGPQRLGGDNAEVGRAIKDGDIKRGVELILRKVKPQFEDGGIDAIPKVFWYEKKMLRHLTKYPNDYAGTLRKIPKKILTLYVHAYQSHLFNEELKQAIHINKIPETISVPGFNVPKIPELKTYPITRRTVLIAPTFKIKKVTDGIAIICFTLYKGEYASTLLSNLMSS